MDLDEINEYYRGLEIKTNWNEKSLTIEEINLVTYTFIELHEKYPYVIIEEIVDCYSEDVIKREETIKNATPVIEEDYTVNQYYQNHEYFKEHPEEKSRHQEIMRELFKKMMQEKIEVGADRYTNAKYSAKYFSADRKILLNHIYFKRLREITIHEFGHAVAFQYNINKNKLINEIFESTDKNRIEELVSNYATTEVEEFIAEVFMHHHLGRRNSLIDEIMTIIDTEVLNGKPMSEMQRLIYESINN